MKKHPPIMGICKNDIWMISNLSKKMERFGNLHSLLHDFMFFWGNPFIRFLADIYFFRGARWRGFPMSGRNAGKQKT